jgi:hypothetical protein
MRLAGRQKQVPSSGWDLQAASVEVFDQHQVPNISIHLRPDHVGARKAFVNSWVPTRRPRKFEITSGPSGVAQFAQSPFCRSSPAWGSIFPHFSG